MPAREPILTTNRSIPRFLFAIAPIVCVLVAGCSDSTDPVDHFGSPPETELTSGPVEADTTTFRVHFYWAGSDKDGEVVGYRFAVDADTARPVAEWRATTAKDTILTFPVDPITAVRPHAFMIAAQDNEGLLDPTPARRIFASSTIPPTSCVVRGPASITATSFRFEWTGYDPDGGPNGDGVPVDRFEYLFLEPGTSSDGAHTPLPPYSPSFYSDLINSASGDSLPAPYGDWKWIPTPELSQRFQNVDPGQYVFALRATDEAGALEQDLDEPCNIRFFTVTSRITGPLLTVCTSLVLTCVSSQTATDIDRVALETLEGSSVSFSWSASADSYGGTIVGYSYALDDTSGLGSLDPARTGVTFSPSQLLPGLHFVFVRAVDDGGAVTNVVIPLLVIEPAFRDPVQGRQVLYVDDSTAPGVSSPSQDATTSIGNYPNDVVETDWYTTQLLNQLGVPVTEWDALNAGYAELQARKPPPLRTLANYSTIVWNVDFNNSIVSSTALWRTLQGDGEWALRNYLRAGGTLILTGFDVSSNTVNPTSLFQVPTAGLCSTFGPGLPEYADYFPRLFMGIDDAELNITPFRSQGARDFIAAAPTEAGGSMGFDSTRLDRGPTGSGAKWITDLAGNGDFTYQPGL
ncbi:MAG TPA: hypothetical protein VFP58_07590, partial [Candidatus Eisenbacteria bacterium]|nr:hypothetical protein [Candidatus Eisenbacteria bacterium]